MNISVGNITYKTCITKIDLALATLSTQADQKLVSWGC